MRLVGLAVVLTLSLALAPLATAAAQSPGKVPRVGVLSPGSSVESSAVQREPFERGLREFGWIPGATVVIEYRYAEGNRDRLAGLAAELVKLKVDLIVARSNPAVAAARSASKSTPIVMSSANDPVALGHVKSLARPGGTITGIANMVYELDAKRLELLKAAIPSLTRVAVLYNVVSLRQTPASSLGDASRALGLQRADQVIQ